MREFPLDVMKRHIRIPGTFNSRQFNSLELLSSALGEELEFNALSPESVRILGSVIFPERVDSTEIISVYVLYVAKIDKFPFLRISLLGKFFYINVDSGVAY